MAEILDGREWTGVVPFRMPGPSEGARREGLAEVYVMPTRDRSGEKAAVCIVVDVRTLRSIETDLAASQAIFGQSPFGFLLIDTDLTVRRANKRFAYIFGGRPTTTAAVASTTICARPEAERMTADAAAGYWRPATPITDMHIIGSVPGSDGAPALVDQPLPGAQRQRPPHRRRLARAPTSPAAVPRPARRPPPGAISPC